MVPRRTVVFSQQKLQNALRSAAPQGEALAYGFVLHARRRGSRVVLGVITPDGESLALTARLLSALARRPLWLYGTAAVVLEAGDVVEGPPPSPHSGGDAPLTSVLVHVEGLDRYAPGAQRMVEVEAQVIAESLVQPLLVLTTRRPASWPR